MPNQVLELHRVSARCFDLAGIRTGSIRDQLLRSSVVVHALHEEGLIGAGRPLLVCGAGPAGMNAAIVAAERGVNVIVLERDKHPFRAVDSVFRHVDPTEYDWPHAHWRKGRFPIGQMARRGIALRQPKSRYASQLASAWYQHWLNFQMSSNPAYGHIDLRTEVDATGISCRDPGRSHYVDVTGYWTRNRNRLELKSFGAVLSCVGHGDERTSLPSPGGNANAYVGMRYWKDTDGIFPDRPLPAGMSNIVVSGGGDGAMQDIQRVLTSYCGKQLYEKLEQAGVAPDADMRLEILSIEECARRQYCWTSSRNGESVALSEWDEAFASLVQKQLQLQPMSHVADLLFRGKGRGARPRVWWVYNEASPGHAYALNRYLVHFLMMLARLADDDNGAFTVIPNSAISEVLGPTGHTCGKPFDCLGKEHRVLIQGEHPQQLDSIHMIIVRHGIEPANAILNQRLPLPEQLSPFDLPPF